MSSSDASSPSPVTLDVGGRKFRTIRATLCYSDHFKACLDRWENDTDQQANGSLFVDVDPDVFKHILNFMRHPSMFPLFWTEKAGFNHALYRKIEAQADFFLLWDLRDWIRSKRYIDAIKAHMDMKRLNHRNFDDLSNRTTTSSDLQVQWFFGSYSGVKEF